MNRGNKYTYDQVKEIIEKDGNTLVSQIYVNSKTKIEIKCVNCDINYNIRFKSYMKGSRCKKCADDLRGQKKRTSEDDIKKLMTERGDTFKRLYFVRNRAKVEFECGKCFKDYNLVYFNYQHRISCICERTKTVLNLDTVKTYIESYGDTLISNDYINSDSLLEIKCNKCGQNFKMSFHTYKRGSRCGLCNVSHKKTIEEVKELIEISNDDKLISKDYKNCISKMDIQCGTCNNIFKMTYSQYRQGNRCPKCSAQSTIEKNRHSQEYVAEFIANDGDLLMSKYINMETKIDIKCGDCKKIFNVSFDSYKCSFTRCSCKTTSKGERLIENYLIKNNIVFEKQKTFAGCKRKIALRYDFYLPLYDVLIEFDGSIHFRANELLGGDEAFNNRRESDIIKNIYCIKNGKKLLRISYNYIRSVEKIVENYLKKDNKRIIEYSSVKTYYDLIMDTNSNLKFTIDKELGF